MITLYSAKLTTVCGCVRYTDVPYPFQNEVRVPISYPTPKTAVPTPYGPSTTYGYRTFVLDHVDNSEKGLAYYVEKIQ